MNTLTIINPIVAVSHTNNGHQQNLFQRKFSDDARTDEQDPSHRQAVEYVLRTELLDTVVNDKRYQPQYKQNIEPRNREIISRYQSTEALSMVPGSLGRLIDRYI